MTLTEFRRLQLRPEYWRNIGGDLRSAPDSTRLPSGTHSRHSAIVGDGHIHAARYARLNAHPCHIPSATQLSQSATCILQRYSAPGTCSLPSTRSLPRFACVVKASVGSNEMRSTAHCTMCNACRRTNLRAARWLVRLAMCVRMLEFYFSLACKLQRNQVIIESEFIELSAGFLRARS